MHAQVNLRFPAPDRKGIYTYTVVVKSDSYIDAEYYKDVKVATLHCRAGVHTNVLYCSSKWTRLARSSRTRSGICPNRRAMRMACARLHLMPLVAI